MRGVFLTLLLVIAVAVVARADIRIGAYNLQKYGKTKGKRELITETLAAVICRYDVIVLQEIEADEDVVERLVGYVNDTETISLMGLDEPIANLMDLREMEKTFQVTFNRPPISVMIESLTDENIPNFWLIGIHIQPGKNTHTEEIAKLAGVCEGLKQLTSVAKECIIIGDLNAGDIKEEDYSKLLNKMGFKDHIGCLTEETESVFDFPREVETMAAGSTGKSHDRILTEKTSKIEVKTPRPFRFDGEEECIKKEILKGKCACNISDHYPVEAWLGPKKGKRKTKRHK